jgi:hypothetical protein
MHKTLLSTSLLNMTRKPQIASSHRALASASAPRLAHMTSEYKDKDERHKVQPPQGSNLILLKEATALEIWHGVKQPRLAGAP